MLKGREAEQGVFARLSSKGLVPGSYLFFGEEGVGKFSFAKELSASFESGSNTLSECLTISPDEERGNIGIDAVRKVRAFLSEPPVLSFYRTVIIENADAMSPEAENAFLKIAEEPPKNALVIFVSSHPESLLPTLLSRLRRLYFPKVPEKDIADLLIESGASEEEALQIAGRSFGRPGFALDIFTASKSKKKKKDADPDFKFETDADFRNFVRNKLSELYASGKDKEVIAEFLKRLELIGRYNVNVKLQLKSIKWTH